MNHDKTVEEIIESLLRFKPRSVFLYGSRGRGDARSDSDYEVGVIFDDDSYVQRSDIHDAITNPNVRAYPFKWSELSSGTFSYVFPKALFLREIIEGGHTIAGEHLIEQIKPLPITMLDLIQRIRFDIGLALAALLSFRSGDMPTSMDEFSKSCLYGVRSLGILELKTFPIGYDQIYTLADKVIKERGYRDAVAAAHAFRQSRELPSIDILFENISLLDTYIEPKIVMAFKTQGDQRIM